MRVFAQFDVFCSSVITMQENLISRKDLITALAGSGTPNGLMQGATRASRSKMGVLACKVKPTKAVFWIGKISTNKLNSICI